VQGQDLYRARGTPLRYSSWGSPVRRLLCFQARAKLRQWEQRGIIKQRVGTMWHILPFSNKFDDSKTRQQTYMSVKSSPEIIFTDSNRCLENIWVSYGRGTKHLPKGWVKDEGRRPLPCDIIWEKDIGIRMRDGVTLLGDIFRPVSIEKGICFPAILPWSPYGKTGTGDQRCALDISSSRHF
jgi:hypothetical protein